MSALRVVIAENEQRAESRDMFAKVWPEFAVCSEVHADFEASRALVAHRPDIPFLDIEMPGMCSLDHGQHDARHGHAAAGQAPGAQGSPTLGDPCRLRPGRCRRSHAPWRLRPDKEQRCIPARWLDEDDSLPQAAR